MTEESECVTLDVYPYEEINVVKKMIEKELGVPPGQQRLFYGPKSLDQASKLSDVPIPNNATLDLKKKTSDKSIQITVKMPDKTSQDYQIPANCTVSQLKNEIQAKQKLHKNLQRLFFRSNALQDDMSLHQYNITNGTTVHLVPINNSNLGIILFVENTKGDYFSVNLSPQDLVQTLKTVIYSIEVITHPNNQNLFCNGVELSQGGQTLQYYGVKNESIIQMRISITVKSMNSFESINHYVPTSSTVLDLKKFVQDRVGIDPTTVFIIYGTKTLSDSNTIGESGIKAGGVVTATHRSRGG